MTRPSSQTVTRRLPDSARARLARFENARTHPSFLTVPAAYGVRAAGFEAVGDVMGAIAFQSGFAYLGRCGVRTRTTATSVYEVPVNPPVTFASSTGSTATSYARQLSSGYRRALDRLRDEARVLKADGVVGVRLELASHDQLRDVVATGTAIRSIGATRPTRPFVTDLPGEDVAKLVLSGWVPVDLHVAVEIGLRHVDRMTMYASGPARYVDNLEAPGYTELRQAVPTRARQNLSSQVVRAGADGGLLSSLTFDSWHRHCISLEGKSDLVGMTTAIGTSIARFGSPSAPSPAPMTMLPLRGEKR